jgi:hypothetical protein
MVTEPVSFETSGENWVTITLDNGVILKMKTEITAVDFKGYEPSGKPMYQVASMNVLRLQYVPRELVKDSENGR